MIIATTKSTINVEPGLAIPGLIIFTILALIFMAAAIFVVYYDSKTTHINGKDNGWPLVGIACVVLCILCFLAVGNIVFRIG